MVAACVEVWRDERAGLPRAGTIGKRWRAVPLIEPVGLSATPKVWAEDFGSGSARSLVTLVEHGMMTAAEYMYSAELLVGQHHCVT